MSIGNIHDHSFTDKLKFRLVDSTRCITDYYIYLSDAANMFRYNSMFHKRNLTQKFADSLWRWRKIKAQTDQLRKSLYFLRANSSLSRKNSLR